MPEPLRLELRQAAFTPEDAQKALAKKKKTVAITPATRPNSEGAESVAGVSKEERDESTSERGLSSSVNSPLLSEDRSDFVWAAGGIAAAAAILVGLLRRRR